MPRLWGDGRPVDRNRIKCRICGVVGHLNDECPQKQKMELSKNSSRNPVATERRVTMAQGNPGGRASTRGNKTNLKWTLPTAAPAMSVSRPMVLHLHVRARRIGGAELGSRSWESTRVQYCTFHVHLIGALSARHTTTRCEAAISGRRTHTVFTQA